MEETTFGDLLRGLRLGADLSQEELAERAELSIQTISALERGIRRAPYRHTLDALAAALRLTPGDHAALLDAAQRRRRTKPDQDRGVTVAAATAITPAMPAPDSLAAAPPDAGLIGRDVAFAEVVALVRHAGARLLTLTGPGGVGKTRLASAVAHALAPDFADGAVMVLLADLRDPAQVAAQIGRALGLPDRALDPAAALRDHLRDRETLLLLDNLEHLLPAAPLVADLLTACPRLAILATSRAPLRLTRERVYALPPLDCPDPAHAPDPATLAEYGAPVLFITRAREARPGFILTPANAAIVAAICARLDGLPLALELAAARLGVLTPAELLDRLAARLPLLTRGARGLPARQRTLRAALDWSHDLLNSGEQALFRRLAAFTGGATLAAIEAVCAPPAPLEVELLDWLGGLVDQGLVRREFADADEPARFTMLETVREYAAEQLAQHRDEETHRRHTDYFLALAEEAAPYLAGADQKIWSTRLAADHDNLRAALRRAIDRGDAATALRLAAALWFFWYATGAWAEGRGWFRAVLALPLPDDAPASLVRAQATVLRAAGGIAIFQSEFNAARTSLDAALDLARRAGDEAGVATALNYLAIMAHEENDLRAAISLHEKALATRRALGVPRDIAVSLNNLGDVQKTLSDYHGAAQCFNEALPIIREIGDEGTVVLLLINLGEVALHLGDYALARARLDEGLALARRRGEARYAAIGLTTLARLLREQGDAAAAAPLLREALAFARSVGARICEAPALAELAEAQRLMGDRAAWASIAESLALAASPNNDLATGDALLARSALAAEADDREAALADARAALARFRAIDSARGIAAALNRIGVLTPDPAEAAACFAESLDRCAAMGQQLLGAAAREGLAAVVAADDPARAAAFLDAAEAIRDRLGTPAEPQQRARVAATRAALGGGR